MTTSTSRRPLDSYETALLDDLRREVHRRSLTAPVEHPASTPPRPVRRPGRWVPIAAAGVVGAAVVASLPSLLGGTPAYALERHPDGSLTVTINRPEAPADLQAALAGMGFTAQVDYVPRGLTCDPSRFTPASSAPGLGAKQVTSVGGRTTFTLVPQQAGRDRTVVIEFDGDSQGGTATVVTADGPVGGCAAYHEMTPTADPPGSGPTASAPAPSSEAPTPGFLQLSTPIPDPPSTR